jgi:hypothetical protein
MQPAQAAGYLRWRCFSARIAKDFRLPSGVLADNQEICVRDD